MLVGRGRRISAFDTATGLAANGLGVGLSYTRPKSEITYDCKAVRQAPITDAAITESIILVSHRDNALSGNAERTRDAIINMAIEL